MLLLLLLLPVTSWMDDATLCLLTARQNGKMNKMTRNYSPE